jgi:dihydroorotate dehydrogenase (fumarate)
MTLRNPLVVSSCPLTGCLQTLERLEEVGAAAVVLPSIFEEQLDHESQELHELREYGAEASPEAHDYFPAFEEYNRGVKQHFEFVEQARNALHIPVIASLNGASPGGWVANAKKLEDAGVDALELNIYFLTTDFETTSADVETRYVELVAAVRRATRLPLAVKIGPYFAALPHLARRLIDAGADGLVLFNRYLHPDIDLERLELALDLELSTPAEMRLPLRWIGILRGPLSASLAATSGVHSADDLLKLLLAGADATMMASTLLRHGPRHLATILADVRVWLEEREYESVTQ